MNGFPKHMPGEDFINSWWPIVLALGLGVLFGIRNYFKGNQCQSAESLKKKTVIVTGANSGIGREISKDLARRGARVIMGCRDVELGKTAVSEMIMNPKDRLKAEDFVVMKLDLASFASIRKFVEEFKKNEKRLDILINNAGIMCHPQEKTEDGNELHLQVNYLGHFLLTQLLLDLLKAAPKARIVNVTALGYQLAAMNFDDINFETREYVIGDAYSESKLAVVLGTRQLSKELEGTNVTVNVVQPGVAYTNVQRHMPFRQNTMIRITFAPIMWFFMKTAKDAAQSAIQCAVAKEEEGVSGKYYAECLIAEPRPNALDDEAAQKLWDISFKLTNLDESEKPEKMTLRSRKSKDDLPSEDQ